MKNKDEKNSNKRIEPTARPKPRFYNPEKDGKEARKEYEEFMLKVYGNIINSSKNKTLQEIIESLGEIPEQEDLPEWLQTDPDKESELHIPGQTEKQKADREELIKRIKEKRLIHKFDWGVIAEKGFSYMVKELLLEENCKVIGKYDHKVQMILDCISHTLVAEHILSKKVIARHVVRKDNYYTVEKLEAIKEEMEYEVKVILKDSEIKQILGLEDQLSNREIFEAFNNLLDIQIEGKFNCYYDPTNTKYREAGLGDNEKLFSDLVYDRTCKKARRTGYEEHRYCFIFRTRLSKIFLANILNGNIYIKPKKFYRLRSGHQNILNHILPVQGYTRLSLTDLSKLVGLKVERTNRQQQLVEKYLNDLVNHGYLRKWKKYGTGKKTYYVLYKEKNYLAKVV